jgi:type IV secretory pathway component VirB8
MRAISMKERGGYMRGFEKHRLTSKERKVVISVAIFMALLWALWVILIIQQLPIPSQGTF